ncbi:MAG: guanylate kinase [Clostridia bacterium]|nr:guanylate kinase [Clostridia bacterium]
MNKGILYVISGPSGTGKGTICAEIIERRDIHLSVSTTSRSKRVGEIAGVTYNYTTPERFKSMADNGELLEWAVYNGNYYGTPKAQIEDMLDEGKDVLLEIEPQGALKVKEILPETVLIFVIPPSMKILRDRLVSRGREDEEEINDRISSAKWEFMQAFKYNYIVENDDLGVCVARVMQIMDQCTAERKKIYQLLNS